MTIHYLSTSFTPITLDTDSLKTSKASLEDLYTKLDRLYLKPLHEQVDTLKKQQRLIDKNLRELSVTVDAELQISSIKQLIANINASPEGSDQYAAEVSEIIASSLESVGNRSSELSTQLDLLKSLTPGDVTGHIETNEQQVNRQQTACQALETAVEGMVAEQEVLNTAMRITEDKTIWDEWLPLLKGFANLDPKNPIGSAIRAAVTGVTNILRIASESVTYTHLVNARKVLQGRMDEHYQRIGNYKKEIDQLNRQNVQLENFQTIATHKMNYEVEVGKVAATLTSFVSIYADSAQDNPLEYARSYSVQGEELSRYLQDMRNELR